MVSLQRKVARHQVMAAYRGSPSPRGAHRTARGSTAPRRAPPPRATVRGRVLSPWPASPPGVAPPSWGKTSKRANPKRCFQSHGWRCVGATTATRWSPARNTARYPSARVATAWPHRRWRLRRASGASAYRRSGHLVGERTVRVPGLRGPTGSQPCGQGGPMSAVRSVGPSREFAEGGLPSDERPGWCAPLACSPRNPGGPRAVFRVARRLWDRRSGPACVPVERSRSDNVVEVLVLHRSDLGVPVAPQSTSGPGRATDQAGRSKTCVGRCVEEDVRHVLATHQVDVIDAQVDRCHLVPAAPDRPLPLRPPRAAGPSGRRRTARRNRPFSQRRVKLGVVGPPGPYPN